MQRRSTDEETQYLHDHIDSWRRELIKLLNIYHSELQTIRRQQAEDMERYSIDTVLQMQAFQAWEEKRLQAASQLRRAEYDLMLLDQTRFAKVETPPSPRERFLITAIKAHRDLVGDAAREEDQHLYNALKGKWTFSDLPEGLPWHE